MLKGTLLMRRGTAGIPTPDSPESAALFKARKVAQESQPRADGESWPRSRTHGCPTICPAEEASWRLSFSTPLPLPRIPGKLLLDQTPRPTGRLSVLPSRTARHSPRRRGCSAAPSRAGPGGGCSAPAPAGLCRTRGTNPGPGRPPALTLRRAGGAACCAPAWPRRAARGPAPVPAPPQEEAPGRRQREGLRGQRGLLRAHVRELIHTAPPARPLKALPLKANEQPPSLQTDAQT